MNDWTLVSNKMIDLYSDTYYGMVNSLLWGQEKALNMTKTLVAQVEANQAEGKKFVDEFTERAKKTQTLFQEVWQEGVKATTNNMNAFRVASDAAVVELDRKIESINEKLSAAPVRKG